MQLPKSCLVKAVEATHRSSARTHLEMHNVGPGPLRAEFEFANRTLTGPGFGGSQLASLWEKQYGSFLVYRKPHVLNQISYSSVPPPAPKSLLKVIQRVPRKPESLPTPTKNPHPIFPAQVYHVLPDRQPGIFRISTLTRDQENPTKSDF